jgi:hypothetical protein
MNFKKCLFATFSLLISVTSCMSTFETPSQLDSKNKNNNSLPNHIFWRNSVASIMEKEGNSYSLDLKLERGESFLNVSCVKQTDGVPMPGGEIYTSINCRDVTKKSQLEATFSYSNEDDTFWQGIVSIVKSGNRIGNTGNFSCSKRGKNFLDCYYVPEASGPGAGGVSN